MIIYVVVEGFSYEGIQSLVRGFLTKEHAQAHADGLSAHPAPGAWYAVVTVPVGRG